MPWRRIVIAIAVAITLCGYVGFVVSRDENPVLADAVLVTRIGDGELRSVAIVDDSVLVSHGNTITAFSLEHRKVSWQRTGTLAALAGRHGDAKLVLTDEDTFQILDLSSMGDPQYGSRVASLTGRVVETYPSMVIAADCKDRPPCRLARYDLTGHQLWSVEVHSMEAPGAMAFSSTPGLSTTGPMTLPTDDVSAVVLAGDDTGEIYDVLSTADGGRVRQARLDSKKGEILIRDGDNLIFLQSSWDQGRCRYIIRVEGAADSTTLWQNGDLDLAMSEPRWGCVFGSSSATGGGGLLWARWGQNKEILVNVRDGQPSWVGQPHEHVLATNGSQVITMVERRAAVGCDDLNLMTADSYKTPGTPRGAWISGSTVVVEASGGTLVDCTDHVIDPSLHVLAAAPEGVIVVHTKSSDVWFLPF